MSQQSDQEFSRSEKLKSLLLIAKYDLKLTLGIVILGLGAALLEGIGLSFILPIIDLIQSSGNPTSEADGMLLVFIQIYRLLEIPFTLGYVIIGVGFILTLRHITSFFVGWLRAILRTHYVRDLQNRAFENALDAKIEYFDEKGSDDILNAIITQANYGSRVINLAVKTTEISFITFVYLIIAFYVSPTLTTVTILGLGVIIYVLRSSIASGLDLGSNLADANEERQSAVQAGTKGIRTIKLFGLNKDIHSDFLNAINKFTKARISQRKNQAALNNFQNLAVSISVFFLIYLAVRFANLSVSRLGVFLFAIFRLGPRAAHLSKTYYRLENNLPHLVRTQNFIKELENYREDKSGTLSVPAKIDSITFDNVSFSYKSSENILNNISFEIFEDEFVSFVGPSGAGKSTIVSLLARMYEPDSGSIYANQTHINKMDISEWRDRLAVVRQDPYIFDDTLRYNLLIGSNQSIANNLDKVCEIAEVNEFIDELPKGYDTKLGDEGVKLSGGQKQRVALARALLKDADILVLDEATSDLDSELEKSVQQSIEQMDQNYTIITIAHQLSTVRNADRIYTIEDGYISEEGTHRELLEMEGKYAELYSIQSRK